MKTFVINTTLFCLVNILVSCSFVDLNPEAKDTTVSTNANSLSNCKFLGNTEVSIWSKADSFQSQDTVENQLDTLARNQAAAIGGNTVLANSKINNGQRTYGVYNCQTSESSVLNH